ncbi:MAG: methyltransferase domain-containing protein [Planctomycetales bacterium]|nr:methyltransferase domain-containing protein [Planctomycetales bacterium]
MLSRELEPEVMDDPEESRAYDNMDHTAVNRAFVTDLLAAGLLDSGPLDSETDDSLLLDPGTGTGLIPIELCERHSRCRIVASDAARSMLEIARLNVAMASCEHRIQLHYGDVKQLEFKDALFDGVMSNSLVHHLPEPAQGLAEMRRVLKPGGWLYIRDLLRPDSVAEVERLVALHAAGESPGNQQLLRQSLRAALRLQEVAELAVSTLGVSVDCVQATSDRHWTLCCRPA